MATSRPRKPGNHPSSWRLSAWLKRVLPMAISALILYYYFHDQDWGKLLAACLKSNWGLALLAVAAPMIIFWAGVAYLNQLHLNWFHGPFPFRELFWVSGAIYILMFVNTALAAGGLLLYIQRKAGITWEKFAGILLFRVGLMLWGFAVILIPGTIAMHYFGLAGKMGFGLYVWWGVLIFGVIYLANAWLDWHHNYRFGLSRLVVRDRNREFWTAFRTAAKKQWLITWALSLPPYLLIVLGFYFVAAAFGIKIPFLHFMTLGPLLLLVMDLPIAFGGFGTATLAWMLFFGNYGDEETVKALTLFLPFTRSAVRALIGLVSLRPAIREIRSLFAAPRRRLGI